MSQKKTFLIIDANAIVHRAYHALPPLQTKTGEIVNAVYGFCLMFFKALEQVKPNYVAACFDVKGPTFRHEQFKEYKAKRPKAPEELYQQINIVKQILEAFAVPIFAKEGYEADDLIASLCFLIEKKQAFPQAQIIILSGDMDNLQLVKENIKVYTMRKRIKDVVLYGPQEVQERYGGLLPSQLVDYKALAGDASDNIPGITGIGEKTAIKILKDFTSLENLYKEIEQNSPRCQKLGASLLQKIKDYKEQAFISQQLAQMDSSVALDFRLEDCQWGKYDKEKVKALLQKLEFFSLIEKFLDPLSDLGKQKTKTPAKQASQKSLDIFASSPSLAQFEKEIENLKAQGILSPSLAQTELLLFPLVRQMEENGILVHEQKLKNLSLEFEKIIEKLRKEIFQWAKMEFNINSPSQVSNVLFKQLGISSKGVKKTPGGALCTNIEELKKIAAEHPIVKLIIEHREIFKLKSGFVDALPKLINAQDKKIHPHFHQLGTETGRMSCSNPNLQNIPIKTSLGKKIRECFVAQPGFLFLSADYVQMELCVAAHLSQDETMLRFLQEGKDLHLMTASLLLEKKEDDVSPQERALAKTLNYGVLYGLGPYGFAERAGITFAKAKEFINRYFQVFRGIAQFTEQTITEARQKEFCQTLFGRKRFIKEINSRDNRLRAQAERIARNFPVQGTSADIMKMAMVKIAQEHILNNDCKILLQIHDELLFEVRKEKIFFAQQSIKQVMENIVRLKAPLKVEIKTGHNWGEV